MEIDGGDLKGITHSARGVIFYDDNNNACLTREGRLASWTFEIGFPCYRGPYLADLLSYGVNALDPTSGRSRPAFGTLNRRNEGVIREPRADKLPRDPEIFYGNDAMAEERGTSKTAATRTTRDYMITITTTTTTRT